MKRLVVVLIFLGGCAGTAMTVDALREQGFQPSGTRYVTSTGELRKPGYEVYWKETRDSERKGHFCVVPGGHLTGGGYNWAITVFVDDKETWSYQSGPLEGDPPRRTGIDCAASGALPEGRLTIRTKLVYWD